MAKDTSKTRTKRTAAERAQADYEVADRKVKRFTDKVAQAQEDLDTATGELNDAVTQRNAYKNLADALGGTGTTVAETVPASAEDIAAG